MSEENTKKIEIVTGSGKDLDISDVSTHLAIAKPKIKDDEEKKKEIVIPQTKKKINDEEKKEN